MEGTGRNDLLEHLAQSMVDADRDEAAAAAEAALKGGIGPREAVEQGLSKGMAVVGAKFRAGEMYLPEVLLATRAWDAAMAVVRPHLDALGEGSLTIGRVVIGTVKGDLHRIGKDFVATLLRTAGFEVKDLGVDVPASRFVEEAQSFGADIVGASALLTTTLGQQQNIAEYLQARGLRDKVYYIVGGGPVTQAWVDQIGADGYGPTAEDAVALCTRLMARKREGGSR